VVYLEVFLSLCKSHRNSGGLFGSFLSLCKSYTNADGAFGSFLKNVTMYCCKASL
jgi:hypothetical protein